ncbi:MAG: cardiolipin synthase [Lachnospiraceae bacterium]|nr:cardiolipin synthase [Lachnospiraceae bacterium]
MQFLIIILSIFEIIYIVNSKKLKDSFKIIWMLVFISMPIFGVLLYFILNLTDIFSLYRNKLRDTVINSKKYYDFSFSDEIRERLKLDDRSVNDDNDLKEEVYHEYSFYNYFHDYVETPIYKDVSSYYFDNGKDAFEDIIKKMKQAKHFIFIEIFILFDGIVWQEMLKVLKEKAKEGVEVKLLVDGLNSILRFNKKYCEYLKSFNIEAKIFKPISPFIASTQNRRDHRKIFVIDNKIAYTGGINIADEYANLYERFGYWKDSCIRIKGKAVDSFTIMFLHLWQIYSASKVIDFDKYLIDNKIEEKVDGAVYVPYTDYPYLAENVSLEIYKYMFNASNEYMYIMTPYLVIDEAMVNTIESAAKRGVDVRIIVPRIPDKKYVFYVNRSYYRSLVLAGAKIYEYMPGFIHSKIYLQDNVRAVVGTANLDYRSLYMHYENGIYIYNDNKILGDIKRDFDKVLSESKEMTMSEIIKIPKRYRFFGAILKVFAPLM